MSKQAFNNKTIAKNTIFLYFRSVLLILISLYTTREILKVLGAEDYGIYQLIGGVVAMFSLLSGAMVTASQRFITYALGKNDHSEMKQVFTTCVTLHVVIGTIMLLILEGAGVYFLYNHLKIPVDRMTAAFWTLQLSIVVFFINIISVPYNSLIVAYERMQAFAYISIVDAVLKLFSVFVLCIIPYDKLIVYAIAILLSSGITRFLYTAYCHRNFKESQQVKFYIEKGLFKEMAVFAGWNLWGAGSAVLRNQGIDVLMNIFFGVSVNAAKGLCNQIQNAVYQFVTNFQSAVNPQLIKSVAQCDKNRTVNLIFQGSRFSFYLLMIFSIPLILTADFVLSLWLVEVPPYATLFLQWTLVYLLFDTQSRFLITSILATGKIKQYQMVVGGTKLLALPLAYFCFKIGLSPIAGIGINILLEIVCLGLRLYYNRMMLQISVKGYMLKVVFRCWGVFGLALSMVLLLGCFITVHPIIEIIMSLFLSILMIYTLGIQNNERLLIHQKINVVIKRYRK